MVNNAGIMGTFGPPEWSTIDDYKSVNAVNLYGMIDVSMTFLPLIKVERGRIVNTSSVSGRMSVPLLVPYCVSKHGVEGFTDGLRYCGLTCYQLSMLILYVFPIASVIKSSCLVSINLYLK